MTQRYPSYRDSGTEWLGDVPAHWRTVPLRQLASYRTSSVDKKSNADESPVRLCNYTDVYYGNRIRADVGEFMAATATAHEMERFGLRPGDVLVTKDSEDWRDIGVPALIEASSDDFVCGYHLGIVRPGDEVDPGYLFHALSSDGVNQQLQVSATGVTRYGIPNGSVESAVIPCPPLDEQRAIVAHLDSETTRIDKLISMQESLIERLNEYMTALITWVVTRGLPPEVAEAAGLDPTPKLKDSGVGWLGEVPEHWVVVENRRLFAERDDRSADGKGELLTVSHITGVGRRSNRPDVGMFMAETLEGYKRCDPGDLVVNTMWAWMGAAGTSAEAGLVSPSYNVYSPDVSRLNPRFADIAYRSRRYVVGMTSESRGIWTSRLRLYPQQFLSLVTAVPPMAEQEAIVAHVDTAEDRAKRMARAIRASIERLREYRSVMISASVTGKIDVRDGALAGAGGGA